MGLVSQVSKQQNRIILNGAETCPFCKRALHQVDTPFWEFPLVYCDCSFMGNVCSVVAAREKKSYAAIAAKSEKAHFYMPFLHTIQSQSAIRNFLAAARSALPEYLRPAQEILARLGIHGSLQDADFAFHFGYAEKDLWQATGFSPPYQSANPSLVLSYLAAPYLVSSILAITGRKQFFKACCKISHSNTLNEAGLHFTSSNWKNLIAIPDPILGLNLYAGYTHSSTDHECPLVFFHPEKTRKSWSNFHIESLVVLVTDELPLCLNDLRTLQARVTYRKVEPAILSDVSSQIGMASLLREETRQSLPLHAFLCEYLTHLAPEKALLEIGKLHLDGRMGDELLCTAQPEEEAILRSVLGLNRNRPRTKISGKDYSFYEGGGIALHRSSGPIQIYASHLIFHQRLENEEKTFFRGSLHACGHSYPFLVEEAILQRSATGLSWFRRLCSKNKLPAPDLTTATFRKWLDLCYCLSGDVPSREIYSQVTFEKDESLFILPRVIVSSNQVVHELAIPELPPTVFEHVSMSARHLPIRVQPLLEPKLENIVFWAAVLGVAALYTAPIYAQPQSRVVLVGSRNGPAGELHKRMVEEFQLTKDGYVHTAIEKDGAFLYAAPLEAYLAALKYPCHFIAARSQPAALPKRLLPELLLAFIQTILEKQTIAGVCWHNGLASDFYHFLQTLTGEPSPVIKEAARKIRCSAFLESSADYDRKSLAARFLSLVNYLGNRELLPERTVTQEGKVITINWTRLDQTLKALIKQGLPSSILEVGESFKMEGGIVGIGETTIQIEKDYWRAVADGWSRSETVVASLK